MVQIALLLIEGQRCAQRSTFKQDAVGLVKTNYMQEGGKKCLLNYLNNNAFYGYLRALVRIPLLCTEKDG